MRIAELIKTLELRHDPIPDNDGVTRYRVEIYRDQSTATHYARVYKWEFFRIQATFPALGADGTDYSHPSDELIMLDDESTNWDDYRDPDIDALIARVVARLESLYHGS